jgi:tellurite resistance protein
MKPARESNDRPGAAADAADTAVAVATADGAKAAASEEATEQHAQ